VVIGYHLWQREFGGDRSVIGRTLTIDGVPVTIIGVTPPHAPTLGIELTPDFAVPQALMARMTRAPEAARVYYVFGRLRPGVTSEAAQARLGAIWPGIQKAAIAGADDPATCYMRDLRQLRVASAANGISPLRARYATPLMLLVGLAMIVLIVACINVGGLLLARAVACEGELSVHLALGATRGRVARQLFAEALLLSTVATCASLPLAFWFVRGVVSLVWKGPVPLTTRLTPDGSVLTVLAIGALVCAAITSAPAIAFWFTRSADITGRHTRTVLAGTGWMGKSLVVLQLALSLALLFTAGLFLNNLARLRAIDPGYRTGGVLWMRLNELPGRPPLENPTAYYRELQTRIAALPGVSTLAFSFTFPGVAAGAPLSPVRSPATLAAGDVGAVLDRVSPEFFTLTRINLIDGRLFTPQDDPSHPLVAVINESLARQLFADGHAIGKRIRAGASPRAPEAEVVGIVRDASPGDVRIAHLPIAYFCIFQDPVFLRVPNLLIHASNVAPLAEPVRRTIASLDHHFPFRIFTIQEQIDRTMTTERTLWVLSSFVGGLGVVLASLGLYALLAYTIGRRQRELGLRMALGASGTALARMVAKEAITLVLFGLAAGLPLAFVLGRFAGALLFGLSPFDPATLAATSLVLLTAALLAVADPARRVAGIDPAIALRAD
jgi:predicted permease